MQIYWQEDRTRKAKVDLQPTHPDQPWASSLINDNYCVDKLQGRLVTGSTQETMNFQTPQNQSVDFCVVTPVHFVKGHSQRKAISPVIVINIKTTNIKICQGCFLCHSIVFCKTCNKCPNYCLKSAFRGETSKFLERRNFWLDLSASPKVVHILRESYTLPFWTRLNLSRSPTIISCYANPHRNLYLLETLHQLMNKNAVELVQNQRSLGFFQPAFLGTKAQQQVETYIRPEQSEPIPQGAKI